MSARAALVTGASSGIGEAIALAFGRAGIDVCVNYHHGGDKAAAVVTEIERSGARAFAWSADVSKSADVAAMVGEIVRRFGGIDILVNNAGIEQPMPLLDIDEPSWDLVVDVNLKGAFLCAQAAARQMVRRGEGGRIINISSVHEDLPMPGNTSYVCAKGAIRMLTRNLGLELAAHGISVVGIGPGAIATPMDAETLADPTKKLALQREIPLGRVGSAEEVAALASYLVSDEARYLTATTVFIDGGLMHATGSL
ncbi:MAG: glucose 1-dehydrogenase [Chloroflexota bacterium]|nr:glucose 1-dehydrogenase [Chloroflexota bacterium]